MSPYIGTRIHSSGRFLVVRNRAKWNDDIGLRAGVQSPVGNTGEKKKLAIEIPEELLHRNFAKNLDLGLIPHVFSKAKFYLKIVSAEIRVRERLCFSRKC